MQLVKTGCLAFTTSAIVFLFATQVNGQSTTSKSDFDTTAARIIIEKRCNEFEKAIKKGDSVTVGNLYTMDTKIIPSLVGRNSIITEVHRMFKDSLTGMKFTIINLWGNDNIIVEDAYVEFYHESGTLYSKGNCLLVWKREEDNWRIFRDVYKPDKK